jgi:hypothetical protein
METASLTAKRSPLMLLLVVGSMVLGTTGVFLLFGLSSVSTGPDQVALHYYGGAFTSTRFANCVSPSNRDFDGPGDKHYSYPSSQTNFVFAPDGDGAAITFVTKDGIEMKVEGVANFLLDTDCESTEIDGKRYPGGVLQRFHELIGNRYLAYMTDDGQRSDGWRQMLSVYIARPLDTAIDRASQAYTYTELYADPAKKAAWERDVLEQLPDLVNRQTDGSVEFFKSFSITLQKPEPPAEIKAALVAQQEAVAKAKAAEAEAAAREAAARAQIAVERAEAEKLAVRIKVLGLLGFLRVYAIEHGLNPFQPGGSVIVDSGNR